MAETSHSSDGPLGQLPGLVWDPSKQRYFKKSAPTGAAADDTIDHCWRETVATSPQVPVAQLPVPNAVSRSLRVVRWRQSKLVMPYAGGKGANRRQQVTCEECAVCFESFIRDDKVQQLPICGHVFHPQCLEPWLKQRGSCPSCRRPVDAAMDAAQKAAEGS